MKESVKLLILQAVSLSLGLFSVFFVAANIPPELFAVVGVYEVVSNFLRVFSNTGVETLAIRNVLLFKRDKKNDKIKELVTVSIAYRFVFASLWLLPLFGYIYYVSVNKFDNNYFSLFTIMLVSSVFVAVNESIILIFKSFNRYFLAALIQFSVNILGRLIALILFINFGFDYYINFIIMLPFIITIVAVYSIRKWLAIKKFVRSSFLIKNLKLAKHFTLSAYISYVYNMLDQMLVSIFFSPEFLGSFSIGKKMHTILKTIVENIFDPLVQSLVAIKDNPNLLKLKMRKINKLRNICLVILICFLPFVILYTSYFLNLLGIDKYPYLEYFVICIYVSQLFLVGMKVKYDFIMLFFSPVHYLRLTVIFAVMSMLSFVAIILFDLKFVFAYMGFTYGVLLVYSNHLFKKKKSELLIFEDI